MDDYKALRREYEGYGWQFTKTNGNHIKGMGPRGELVFLSLTPSDYRALKEMRANMQRATRNALAGVLPRYMCKRKAPQ